MGVRLHEAKEMKDVDAYEIEHDSENGMDYFDD